MRVFYQLLANTLISSITTSTVWFAVIFYLYLQTQSVLSTSILSGVYLVCVALTGIWFGSIVDHQRKKTAMLLSNGLSLFFFLIVFVLYVAAPPGTFTSLSNPRVWFFIPLTLFGVIAGNIRMIALPTVVTLLIPEKQRDKANGLVGTVSGVGFLVTSVISGFLVGHSGMYWVLLLAIGSLVASTIHLLSISIPEKKIVATQEHPKKIDLRGTIRVISSIPGLLPLIFFTMFNNFLGGVFMALMDAYGLSLVSVQVWGLLWGGLSCAFILGGIIIAKYGLGKNPLWVCFVRISLFGEFVVSLPRNRPSYFWQLVHLFTLPSFHILKLRNTLSFRKWFQHNDRGGYLGLRRVSNNVPHRLPLLRLGQSPNSISFPL